MEIVFSLKVYALVLGLIVGSFLNVVILRHNTGKSLKGRSSCFSCGHRLKWFELIPVASFLFQGGRCRACGSYFSLQYPLVELTAGLLWLAVATRVFEDSVTATSVFLFFVQALFMSALVVIFVYDLRHKIIPDLFVYAAAVLALVLTSVDYIPHITSTEFLIALGAGPLVALPLFAIWFFSQGRAMGFGDIKLALVMGWFLGLEQGVTALLFAFWVGALVSLSMLALSRLRPNLGSLRLFPGLSRLTMKSEVPFAPFLLLGLLLVYFLDINLIRLFL